MFLQYDITTTSIKTPRMLGQELSFFGATLLIQEKRWLDKLINVEYGTPVSDQFPVQHQKNFLSMYMVIL